MTPSEDLFHLIKSLSGSERRHFALYTSHHVIGEQNEYMKLFYIIEKQEKYDEVEIKRKHKGEPFVKRFAAVKNYLQNLILKSLRVYYGQKNSDLELNELLGYISIVFEKAQYAYCEKLVEKAKKTALRFERYTYLLEILRWELRIMRSKRDYEALERFFKENAVLIQKIFSVLQNEQGYMEEEAKIFQLQRQRFLRGDQHEGRRHLIEHALLKDEKKALSFRAKSMYWGAHGLFSRAMADVDNSIRFMEKRVEVWEANKHQIADDPWGYITILNALLIVYMENGHDKEALAVIAKMNKIPSATEKMQWEVFLTTGALKLTIYHYSAQFEKGLRFFNEINSRIKQHDTEVRGTWMSAYFIHGCLFNFYCGNLRESLRLLNKALDETPIKDFEQEYCFLRILNLMIHFEMGDEDLLESSIRSTYRALSKRNQHNRFEQLMLKFVKENVGIRAEEERRRRFVQLKKDLEKLAEDPGEKRIIDNFKIGLWVDARIKKPLPA